MIRRADGELFYAIGRSRSGKTKWVQQRILNHKRVIVWDTKAEFSTLSGYVSVSKISDLIALLKKSKGSFKVAFVPFNMKEDFELFCRCALNWLRQKECTIVVEELSDVSTPSKAPLWWGIILRRSLSLGPTIYALTQRPQETDKTILGNFTMIHVHAPNTVKDRKYIANDIGIELDLIPSDDLKYVERFRDGTIKQGKMVFK